MVEASPAAAAGLRPEDLLLDVGETPVEGMDDLQRLMVGDVIGQLLTLRVYRGGSLLSMHATPVELRT